MTQEELKKQIGIIQQMLDVLRKALGIQTQLDKLKLEETIKRIAKEEGVDSDLVLAVIRCESGVNPKAINKNTDGTIDYGICQYNSYWYIEKGKLITKDEALNDPEKCVRLMCRRFKQGFAKDWVCYKTSAYVKYLPKVG